jgi:hypothetical protein
MTDRQALRNEARRLANPCLRCGGEKLPGKGTRYCSLECLEAARIDRVAASRRSARPAMLPCLHCGKPRTDIIDGRDKFCTPECRKAYAYVRASGSQQHRSARHRAWRQATQHARHGYHLGRQFGITSEQYDAILDAQGGVCAVCLRRPVAKRLAVDHSHDTGEIRGLIHSAPCNRILGDVRDNPATLRRMADYLENPPARAILGAHRVPVTDPPAGRLPL